MTNLSFIDKPDRSAKLKSEDGKLSANLHFQFSGGIGNEELKLRICHHDDEHWIFEFDEQKSKNVIVIDLCDALVGLALGWNTHHFSGDNENLALRGTANYMDLLAEDKNQRDSAPPRVE